MASKACLWWLATVFPATTLQIWIVHLIDHSLNYARWKDRKLLAAAIGPIYTAASAEAEQAALDAFEQGPWGQVPQGGGRLAPGLGTGDPVIRVSAVNPPGDLRDQCY